MVRNAVVLALLSIGSPSTAQMTSPSDLTDDQMGYIVYDRCMMSAAIEASHTDVRDEDVFGLAKAKCARTRALVMIGHEKNTQFVSALDAADTDKAANFPTWIKGVRERRKAVEQQNKSSAGHAGH